MNRSKITWTSCVLFSMAVLFAGTPAQNKESLKDGEIPKKQESASNKIALKNWNEADNRLPNEQHRQQVKVFLSYFPVLFSIREIPT